MVGAENRVSSATTQTMYVLFLKNGYRWTPLTKYELTHETGKPSFGKFVTALDESAKTGDEAVISSHPQRLFAITKIDGKEFHVTQTNLV